jgi:hypothetical protein
MTVNNALTVLSGAFKGYKLIGLYDEVVYTVYSISNFKDTFNTRRVYKAVLLNGRHLPYITHKEITGVEYE